MSMSLDGFIEDADGSVDQQSTCALPLGAASSKQCKGMEVEVTPPHYGSPYRDDQAKTFTIPISGSVVLFGPEIDVLSTDAFQRLGRIRQLGTAHLVYRGANHTRLEHSIGTLHRAEQMIRAVNENPKSTSFIDPRGRRLARMAALLHDLPHIPFGHTLEDEFGLLVRHDRNKGRISELMNGGGVAQILASALGDEENQASDEYDELLAVLDAKTDEEVAALPRPFIADLVGDTVCADALDYVERDLAACGMPGVLGTRFLDYFTITSDTATRDVDRRRMALRLDKRGMPRPDVESEVVKLLSYRYELAERVYFHHAKNSASVMVGRAVVEAGLVPDTAEAARVDTDIYDRNFRWLSDDMLLSALRKPAIAAALDLHRDPRDADREQLAASLAEAILRRRLYKICYMAVRDDLPTRADELWAAYGDAAQRRQLEDHIAQMAGVAKGMVLVHLPHPRGLAKLAEARVLTELDEVLSLEKWDERHSGRFRALNAAHERLWRVTVYVHPKVDERGQALVRAAAMDAFGVAGRYRAGPRRAAYLDELFSQEAEARGWHVRDRVALANPPAALSRWANREEALEEIEALIRLHRQGDDADSDD